MNLTLTLTLYTLDRQTPLKQILGMTRQDGDCPQSTVQTLNPKTQAVVLELTHSDKFRSAQDRDFFLFHLSAITMVSGLHFPTDAPFSLVTKATQAASRVQKVNESQKQN